MVNSIEGAIDPEPAHPSRLLEQAINNLSLGLVIFDNKREVVFCNTRYLEIYGLTSEQARPGTPISNLIQHRLNLGLKVLSKPHEYIRERVGNAARSSHHHPGIHGWPDHYLYRLSDAGRWRDGHS